MKTPWLLPAVAALGAAALAAVAVVGRDATAQPRRPGALPSCNAGELLVSEGNGVFGCRAPAQALALSGCSAGDFVVTSSGGSLHCERPSSTSWGARHLLPECSSGAMLVSEGFGRWRCVDEVLPRCSSGALLQSEGSGRWRCVDEIMPRCSSGETLVSEGGGRWRCAAPDRR